MMAKFFKEKSQEKEIVRKNNVWRICDNNDKDILVL